jgi:hypothetical protein
MSKRTHKRRTSDAQATHKRRTSDAQATHKRRTSDAEDLVEANDRLAAFDVTAARQERQTNQIRLSTEAAAHRQCRAAADSSAAHWFQS